MSNFELKQNGAQVQKAIDYAMQVPQLSEAIADQQTALNSKLPKNFGADNVGKILVVGTDGNLTLTDMPEGGVSGDVVGTLDESNNILLSGDIAEGTYPLKWVMDDGTLKDAGTLTVTLTPEPEAVINWLEEVGYVVGKRISLSSGVETDASTRSLTGFIPCKYGQAVRIKDIDVTDNNTITISPFDINKQAIKGTASNYGTTLHRAFVEYGTQEADGVYACTITKTTYPCFTEDMEYIRIVSSSFTDDSVITVDQKIV